MAIHHIWELITVSHIACEKIAEKVLIFLITGIYMLVVRDVKTLTMQHPLEKLQVKEMEMFG